MAQGYDGFLGISKQNSWGDVSSVFNFVPIVSESVVHNINVLEGAGIVSRYDGPQIYEGLHSCEGAIDMELHPVMAGHFLKGLCGVCSTAVAQSGYVFTHQFTLTQAPFDSTGQAALPPYSLQIYRGVEEAFRFSDCQFNTAEITVAAGQMTKINVGVISRVCSLMTAATASYYGENIYAFNTASISLGNAAVSDYEEVRIALDNRIEGVATLNGTRQISRAVRNNYRLIKVSGTLDLPDLDEYDAFVAQSERRLFITLTNPTQVRSGYYEYCTIDIPTFRYEAFPVNIGGAGRITVGFAGRALYNSGSGTAMKITLQNTLSSY